MPLVVIIVVAVSGASAVGHGTAALITVIAALLAVVAEELARAAMQYWMRAA